MNRKRNLGILGVVFLIVAVLAVQSWPGRDSVSAAGAVSIDATSYYSCALTSDGGLRCWGDNGAGMLGDGTTVGRSTPVDVVGLASGVREVSAGGYHTCALTDAGGVKCWGENMWGELGNGTRGNYSAVPVDVLELQSGAVSVSAGNQHTCAALASGGVKCWGDNGRGEVGDGTTVDRTAPVDVVGLDAQVVQVAAGASRTCALSVDGGVECWGRALGPTPATVPGLESGIVAIFVEGDICGLTTAGGVKCGTNPAVLVPGLESGVVDVSGDCAVMSDGAVRCGGIEIEGLDGEGVAVAVGLGHTCVVMASGGIKCWGSGSHGQLGNGTIGGNSETPVDVLEVKPGWCPAGGCPTPPPGPVPLPDCPDVAPSSGSAGMTLTGPATVLADDTFTVCVNADPEPDFGPRGFQTEVEFPEGIDWVQRPACASIGGDGEAQVTVDGAPPGMCLRGEGAAGQARHGVDSGGIDGPPLDAPLGRLLELDAVCSEPGSYTLVLTAGGAFSAAYFDTDYATHRVSTINHEGREVADIHTVTCLAPDDLRDSDGDGCTDVQELSMGPEQGGYRDPNNFWDFFDVPEGPNVGRDGAVSGRDFFAVLRHFNTEGDSGIDPLSPPPETGYHPAYDRGAAVGPNAWNVGEANGSTSGTDFFASLAQFNHECN